MCRRRAGCVSFKQPEHRANLCDKCPLSGEFTLRSLSAFGGKPTGVVPQKMAGSGKAATEQAVSVSGRSRCFQRSQGLRRACGPDPLRVLRTRRRTPGRMARRLAFGRGASISNGVVEDGAQGMARTGPHAADAVARVDAVAAATALDRAVVDGEDNRVAALQRRHLDPALHARTLFGQDELAHVKSAPGSESRATCSGTRGRRRDPGAGSCNRPARTAAAAASVTSDPPHGRTPESPHGVPCIAARRPCASSTCWPRTRGAGKAR
jgi:hypothetical protein